MDHILASADEGPVAFLEPGGGVNWRQLNTGLINELMRFAATNCEVNTVQQIVYGGVLSGDVLIETAAEVDKHNADMESEAAAAPKPQPVQPGMERANKSDRVKPRAARQEAAMRMRSTMWTKFAVDCQKQMDLIGFCCMASKPLSADYALIKATDTFEPCVLQLDKLSRMEHRVDVLGTHEFRFYARSAHGGTETQIKGVKVVGPELPNGDGEISSKLLRLYTGPWQNYNEKLRNMRRAEHERANPTLVTVEDSVAARSSNSDPKLVQSSIGLEHNSHTVMSKAQADHAQLIADQVDFHNCCATSTGAMNIVGPAAAPAVSRRRYREPHGGFTEYEVQPGRMLASNHLAEAPADTLPHKQAWMEDVCLELGIPMSMLSKGDATGKAKLSNGSGGAHSDSSRIFIEAQASRKRKLECLISSMHLWMYTGDSEDEEVSDRAVVSVTISGIIEPSLLQSLHQEGSLRYTAYVTEMARSVCLAPANFHSEPLINIADLAGIAMPQVPPEPKEEAGPAKKKAKKGK